MARKYWKMLDTLVQFKPYWVSYENERLKPLIDYLTPYEYIEEDTPLYHDRKRISKETGLNMNRVNRGILHLYNHVLKQFTDNPPDIKINEVSIHIHIPFDEVDKARRKNPKYNPNVRATYTNLKLSHIPRVGEFISLEFMDDEDFSRFTYGHVHEVRHEISDKHKIIVDVHPTNNHYYRWTKLKEEYEYWEQSR